MDSTKRAQHPLLRTELANIKVLHEQGYTPNAIGKLAGRDPKTVCKWLQSDVYQEDPELQKLVEQVREKESEDLLVLGAKARARLHALIPNETKIIPLVAAMDRCFQQRRLLEGRSTANAHSLLYWYKQAEQLPPGSVGDWSRPQESPNGTPEAPMDTHPSSDSQGSFRQAAISDKWDHTEFMVLAIQLRNSE